MRVIITRHARKRLTDLRQGEIAPEDIMRAASSIPGQVPAATRFRGCVAASGKTFDLVIKDVMAGRLVITIIGQGKIG